MNNALTPGPSPSGRGESVTSHSWRLRPSAPLRWNLLVFLFYLFLATLITWPLVTVLGTHFAGYANGDAHEMTRHIWWLKHALQTGQPLFFQPLLAYPDGLEGVILWSNPLQFFPAWLFAFVLPLPAAYNLQALLNLALNGWAAYFLVRHLTRHTPAALLASVVFMASPAIQGHLAGGHGGLLVQWPLPLLAWALVRLREQFPVARFQSPEEKPSPPHPEGEGSRTLFHSELETRNSELLSELGTRNSRLSTQHSVLSTILFLVLLPLGHTLQLIYAGLPLVGLFALALLAERNWRALRWLIAALLIALLMLLVWLLPVASATLGTVAYTDEGGSVTYSLDLLAPVTPSFNHPLYGQWEYTHRVLGTNIVEGSAYAGVIVMLLALVAAWKRPESRWWLLVALAAWLLALGPLLKLFDTPLAFTTDGYETYVTLPWALLQDLPIFNLARTPGRFNFLLALALAVLAGYGWSIISRQFSVFGSKNLSVNPNSAGLPPEANAIWLPVFGGKSAEADSNPPGNHPPQARFVSDSSGLRIDTQSKAAEPKTENQKLKTENSELGTRNFRLSTPYSALGTFLLIALILLDYQSFWPLPTYSAEIPAAVHELAQRDDVRAVFDLPWDNVLAAKDALWLQTAHHKPMIAGHVSRKTPVDPAKLSLLQGTLDPALLNEAGVDVVILHKQYNETLSAQVREQLGEPFYEDDGLAVYDVPETDSIPYFAALPATRLALNDPEKPVTISSQASSYLYAPFQGWTLMKVVLQAGSRDVQVLLDGKVIQHFRADTITDQKLSLRLPLVERGFHTVTLSVDPPCPTRFNTESLECQTANVSLLTFSDFGPGRVVTTRFDRGVTLLDSFMLHLDGGIPPSVQGVTIALWWQFDQPRTEQDIRFIKVLDKDGNQVAGLDETLGSHAAGSQWVETVTLDLPADLSPGSYEVYTGWYSYPDMQRFGVQADTPRAQDGLAYLGSVTVE